MATVLSFRELVVWQRAVELSLAIYGLTKGFPREEMFGLTSQLRRASVSVASNIAEGQSRGSTGEFLHFPEIARGSNAEVQTQLVIAKGLGLGTGVEILKCESIASEVGRMLNGLMATLKSSTPPSSLLTKH